MRDHSVLIVILAIVFLPIWLPIGVLVWLCRNA